MSKETEKFFKYLDEKLEGLDIEDEEELKAAIDRITQEYNDLPNDCWDDYEPEDDLAKAEELIEKADGIDNWKERKKLLKKAISICDYACDAYDMLAELTETKLDALELLKTGIWKFEEHKGEEYFRENEGAFWSIMETRPYMRCYSSLITLTESLCRYSEAIKQKEYMLKMCKADNLGIRYSLLHDYILLERFEDAEKLVEDFDEYSAFFIYPQALMEYKLGNYPKAVELLREGYKLNKHIFNLIIGKERPSEEIIHSYSAGSKEEANIYIYDALLLLMVSPSYPYFLKEYSKEITRKNKIKEIRE